MQVCSKASSEDRKSIKYEFNISFIASFIRSLFRSSVFSLFIQLAFNWSIYWPGKSKKASRARFSVFPAVGWSTWVLLHTPSRLPEGSMSSYMTFSRQQKQTIQGFLRPSVKSCIMLLLSHSLGQNKLHSQ